MLTYMHGNQKQPFNWRYESLTLFIFIIVLYFLFHNWHLNQPPQRIQESWSFLVEPSSFFISDRWLSFEPSDPYWYAILIAAINTFVLGISVITFGTCLGVLIGLFEVMPSLKMKWFSSIYIDVFRNTPLVAQLFFWYFGVVYCFPYNDTTYFAGLLTVNIRSITMYMGDFFLFMTYVYAMIFVYFLVIKRSWGLSISALLMFIIYLNFDNERYFSISTEWLALCTTLTLYSTAYIAEIVKTCLLSIPTSVDDAASSIGLTTFQKYRLILFPTAAIAMRPMMVNQYVTIMKNTSIGLLIGYPELMNILIGTIVNATGQTMLCVSLMMVLYLLICYVSHFIFTKQANTGAS